MSPPLLSHRVGIFQLRPVLFENYDVHPKRSSSTKDLMDSRMNVGNFRLASCENLITTGPNPPNTCTGSIGLGGIRFGCQSVHSKRRFLARFHPLSSSLNSTKKPLLADKADYAPHRL